MPDIAKTRRDELIYRLQQDQLAVHTRLRNINPELGSLFLKPRQEGDFLFWELEDRNIQIEQITDYSKLKDSDLKFVQQKLSEVKELILQYNDSVRILDLPSIDCIKLLETNKGPKIVIHSWGFLPWDNSRGTSIIDIKIPLVEFIEPSFLFKYWDESPALSKQIKILDAGFATTHVTDNNGQINLGKHSSGKQLSFLLDQDRTESIVITQDNKKFVFILPLFTEVKIKVIEDTTEDPIGNYFLKIKVQNIETEYQTGMDGTIVLNNIEAGSNIHISDENIKVEHKVQNNNNDIIFRVKEKSADPIVIDDPKPAGKRNITFTVYGLKGEKLYDYKLDILQEGNRIETIKDDSDPSTRIVSKDRLKMEVSSVGEVAIEKQGKSKSYQCEFITKENEYSYTLQIKKRRNWLWLFLLLFFLILLLLPFNKDVKLKVVNVEKIGIENVDANLKYQHLSFFNFNRMKFFTIDSFEKNSKTNGEGVVIFSNNATTVFDLIFKLRRNAKINLSANNICYEQIAALIKFYKFFKTHEVEIPNKKIIYEVLVLERKTHRPIEDAAVVLLKDSTISLQLNTDQEGKVNFENIDFCSKAENLFAYKYYSDFDTLYSNKIVNIDFAEHSLDTLFIYEPEPCQDLKKVGNNEGEKILLSTPNPSKIYSIEYDFRNIPDRLLIRAYPNGGLILDTGVKRGYGNFSFKPSEVCNSCKIIYLEIITDNPDTQWFYYFKCND